MSTAHPRAILDIAQLHTRPATEDDRRFCYEVKRAALRAYIEPIWGWDETVQERFHLEDWRLRKPDIIRLGTRDIGTIEVVRAPNHFHLGEFYVLPELQRQGIGSHFLRQLLREADDAKLPIHLEVLRNNPARQLYLRFGFTETGQTSTHHRMVREPRQAGD